MLRDYDDRDGVICGEFDDLFSAFNSDQLPISSGQRESLRSINHEASFSHVGLPYAHMCCTFILPWQPGFKWNHFSVTRNDPVPRCVVIFSIEYPFLFLYLLKWHLIPNHISQDIMDKSLNFLRLGFLI